MRPSVCLTACALIIGPALACTVYNTPEVFEVPRPAPADSFKVTTAVRAHLLDGQTVFFRQGMIASRDTLYAAGDSAARRYALNLEDAGPVTALPLDSVLGLESVKDNVNGGATLFLSLVDVAASVVAVGAVIVAIECIGNPKCFGSCPTIYSDSAGTPVLEAEGFSYSIAPIFEAPDLDRLRAQPDANGILRLEVRDEAYETHYINHIGLVEVRHDPDELALTDDHNRPIVVRDLRAPAAARDRLGHDVRGVLARADGEVYRTPDQVLARADSADPNDDLDLTFPQAPGRDTVAIVFRMRNSLLNTVLLYELMLGDPGLKSLDWVGRDLNEIGPAARLGRWYAAHMGMRVSVWDGTAYREVARIADTGPVAWKDVAVRVPVFGGGGGGGGGGDSIRVRLSYVADDWRIDQVRLASGVRTPESRAIAPSTFTTSSGRADSAALDRLRAPDAQYLVTSSGQRFFLSFATGPNPAGASRTFLLASQGYYIEWLRGSWLRTERLASTFTPTDDALVSTLRRWRSEQTDLERRFAATRVPVR